MMNNQIMGALRALIPAVVAWAAAKGWLPLESASDVTAAILAIGAAGWSVYSNRPKAVIAAAAAMPGTSVTPKSGGKAVIEVVDKDLAVAAKDAATPA